MKKSCKDKIIQNLMQLFENLTNFKHQPVCLQRKNIFKN